MGRDVYGAELPAPAVRENRLQAGRAVEFSADGTTARVTSDGHAFVSGRRVAVDKLHVVGGDVDFRVGNVRYAGNIQVQGDVRPGFRAAVNRGTSSSAAPASGPSCAPRGASSSVAR